MASPASSTCRAPSPSRTGRCRRTIRSVRRDRRGGTSPSRSCRGCRARCATRRSTTSGRSGDPDENLFDRSFDLQLQLLKERGAWQPSLAIGLRDFLGTGIYSAEYLVASKTVAQDFTVTGGVGWGRLSGVGGVENPFCAVAGQLLHARRGLRRGRPGRPSATSSTAPTSAFFGGVEWRTPIDGLTLKAEYSSDAYTQEQAGGDAKFRRKSPVNFGAEYRVTEGVTLGGYYMYGDTVGFNIVFSRQSVEAAGAAEPAARAAAVQPAAAGRAGDRLGQQHGGARDS